MKNKLLFLLLVVFAACSPDPVDTTGSISGTIRDALDNSVLQGASVTLSPSGRTTVTGNDGRYQFSDIEMGDYTVSASKADYVSDSKPATVQVGQNTQLDFVLHRGGSALSVSPLELDFGDTDTKLNLNIVNNGQATMTWEISENTTWLTCSPTSGTVLAGKTGSVAVTVDRTGLAKGTYTNTLVVSSNNGGSATVRFTMSVGISSGGLPQVALLAVDNVTDVAATFVGALSGLGTSRVTAHGFCWSTQQAPSLQQGQHIDMGQSDATKDNFSYGASGLSPNTTYYVRAYATNAEGTVYSSREERFTTDAAPQRPTVETGATSQITSTSAKVAGNIIAIGHKSGITAYGHCWSSDTREPTIDHKHTELGTTQQAGTFSSELKDLTPGTLYYVRAYARNPYGISYGQAIQFTTAAGVIVLTTLSVSDIAHDEATCGGRITELQGNSVMERGVCWSTHTNPTLADNYKASTDKTNDFSVRFTGLTEKTSYHVRSYAKSETGVTYYGQDVQFQTTHVITLPVLSNVSASNITYRKATFTAAVSSLGGGTLKRSGFCYSTTHNPTISSSILSCGTSTDLRATATSLKASTTYYVRAFAENEKGVAYSSEYSITTNEEPDGTIIGLDDYSDDNNWDGK